MSSATTSFADLLRHLRTAAALSQEELAERAEIHRTHVGFVERGQRSPSVDVVVRVGAALGVSASRLLAEAEALHRAGQGSNEG